MIRFILLAISGLLVISCAKNKEVTKQTEATGTLFDQQNTKAVSDSNSMYGLWQSSEFINEDSEVASIKRIYIERNSIVIAKKCYDTENPSEAVYVQAEARALNSNEQLHFLETARQVKTLTSKGVEERCRVTLRRETIAEFDIQPGTGGTAIYKQNSRSSLYFKIGN